MTDGPVWFRPKRYGFGATPVTWQGWALTLGFVGVVFAIVFAFGERPLLILSTLAPLVVVFIIITAKTTRGGWRWRWGNDQ